MKDYPKKICQELTAICIQIEAAYSVADMTNVVLAEQQFRIWGYEYPAWVHRMISWKLDNPILSSEESFRKYYKTSLSVPVKCQIHHLIFNLYDEIRAEAYLQVLYAIAGEILVNNQESELAFEWHCKSDTTRSLEASDNLKLLKFMLERESAFWQPNVRLLPGVMQGKATGAAKPQIL